MRVLLDTNILIHREQNQILSPNLQELLRSLNMADIKMLVHPESVKEIANDPNENRRNINLSKVGTYLVLEQPPNFSKDYTFLETIKQRPNKKHDKIDNALLYAIYKDAAHFLVTEDKGIHKKADKLSVKDRVLSIEEGVTLFGKTARSDGVNGTPVLQYVPANTLNLNDPFFDSLKEDYKGFLKWWEKISREGRECWVYLDDDDAIGAFLMYKLEDEVVELGSIQALPRKKRVKISTLKVSRFGFKVGELFIKLSVGYAQENGVSEIYLTHYTKEPDTLVSLIQEYGFKFAGLTPGGEGVFLKRLYPDKTELEGLTPAEISKQFWPTFCDGDHVHKFIVPIKPEYHLRLFKEGEEQTLLPEHAKEFITQRNTIGKAYLSHARIKKLSAGDILLFYRSRDQHKITTLGVVEKVFEGLEEADEIQKLVGKRSVYSPEEMRDIALKPTIVILFSWHLRFRTPPNLNLLRRIEILKAAPQTIMQISHEKYLNLKGRGGIDERFTVN